MDQTKRMGTIYMSSTALLVLVLSGLFVRQVSNFDPEIQPVTINFRQPEVLGVESGTTQQSPTSTIELCKVEAETAWQAYLDDNTLTMVMQHYCDERASLHPCETPDSLTGKYSNPASEWFIADVPTREKMIDDTIKLNQEARMIEVQKIMEGHYREADRRFQEAYTACRSAQ